MPCKPGAERKLLLLLIRKKDKNVSVLFVLVPFFQIYFNVFNNPVDKKDDQHGNAGLNPEAIATHAAHSGTAPDGGGTVEAVDVETVLHDNAGTQKADTRDHLGEDTEVIVVDGATRLDSSSDNAFGQQDEEARTYGDQCVDSQTGIAFAQLALDADKYTSQQRTEEAVEKNVVWHVVTL